MLTNSAFGINQSYFKAQFNYYLNSKNALEFGLSTLYYQLHPGTYEPLGKNSLVAARYSESGTVPGKCGLSQRQIQADQ